MSTEEDRPGLSREVSHLESQAGTHAHHPLMRFPLFEQLKQRNVFRVAALYLVVCWLILDPVHVIFHMLEVPAWANRLVITIMALGFPAVLIFAWVYEITPRGLKFTAEVPRERSIRRLTGRRLDRAIIAVLAVALTYFIVDKFWIAKHLSPAQPAVAAAESAAAPASSGAPAATAPFAPPPHSIAVLPFVNMSGDPSQEYFSDGLTEELLDSLSRTNELQVAARTSAFAFKGKDIDIGTIARKLNVAAVLEGSVRRSGQTVRITAQLINAVTGFHLWSRTYDRSLGDILALQTEIANAVANALKVTLLGDVAAKIEAGGTRNPAAFDTYLRAQKTAYNAHSDRDMQSAIALFTEAIGIDPNYALAFAGRSLAQSVYAGQFATGPAIREAFEKAEADARKAIALAPDLADGYTALASSFEAGFLDFTQASQAYERAMALGPGNVRLLGRYGRFAVQMGRTDAGLAIARRAVTLDPLNPIAHSHLGQALLDARRFEEARAAFQDFRTLDPDDPDAYGFLGLAYYVLGNLQSARESCLVKHENWSNSVCLALSYEKLGEQREAQAELAKLQAAMGEALAYQYAEIYAQWGNVPKALEWVETALRLRDPGLVELKTDPLLDPLRKEPRFEAVLQALKFPS